MNTIWKFPLRIQDYQEVILPFPGIPRSVMFQDGILCLWAEVDTDAKSSKKLIIYIYGTGHEIPDHKEQYYIGSVQDNGLVWHVYFNVEY